MRGARLVIANGGSTLLQSIACGRACVAVPIAGDQPYCAKRCQALGVARIIEPADRNAAAIRAAVRTVLDDPAYRDRAGHMRDEASALQPTVAAVTALEQVADKHTAP